ncbi:MAG: transcriptional repressor [Propionibacteriaceae bacterium]|nr:transcriptional repressor [Propionibacteriaceae bacterium]
MTSTDTPRRTRQRSLVWEYLSDCESFQTAQDVHDGLKARGTPVSLPTVYRTLTAMAENQVVDHLLTDGQSAYRLCSPEHHHHLICRVCRRTIELTQGPVEQWADSVARTYGFTEIAHVTEISGVCPRCQELTLHR